MPPKGQTNPQAKGKARKHRRKVPNSPNGDAVLQSAPTAHIRRGYLIWRAVTVLINCWDRAEYEESVNSERAAVERCQGHADWTVNLLTDDVYTVEKERANGPPLIVRNL